MANNVLIRSWYPISGVWADCRTNGDEWESICDGKIRCYKTRKKNIGKLIDRVMPSPQNNFAAKFSNKCNCYNGNCLSTCQRYCKQHYRYQHFNMHEYFMNRVLGFCFTKFLEIHIYNPIFVRQFYVAIFALYHSWLAYPSFMRQNWDLESKSFHTFACSIFLCPHQIWKIDLSVQTSIIYVWWGFTRSIGIPRSAIRISWKMKLGITTCKFVATKLCEKFS